MQLPVGLDRTLRQPLAVQLADQLRDAIRQGRIPAGARLPSSRGLAEQLGLGRNTVLRVYDTLMMEGLLESRASSGVFATREAQREAYQPTLVMAPPSGSGADLPALPTPPILRTTVRPEGSRQCASYDFVPGRPSPDLFPVKTWRRLLQSCLSYRGAAGLAGRGDPAGLYELRAAIAEHISMTRGLVADAERVLIVAGIQEAVALLARLFLSAGATVVTEDPSYQGAVYAFEATGAHVIGVPVDDEGLVTGKLPEVSASLVYVTPAHQFPVGSVLSQSRRRELIAWARKHGAYIVEDDYDGEFHYDAPPLQAVAGVAPEMTLHLGTFSTTLGPGLRLGYVVAPPQLVAPLRAAKALTSGESQWLDQAALAEFLRGGSFGVHLTRSRAQYRESRDALLSALRRNFGRVEISGESAGLHVLWQLPAGMPGAMKLEELALRQRVGIYGLAKAGAFEREVSALTRRSVMLGYAGLSPKQIEQGILRLSDAVDDALDDHHDFLDELLLDAPRSARSAAAGPARSHSTRLQKSHRHTREDSTPMGTVRGIYRYPVKGLSPESLPGVSLEPGKPFPFDRVFALVRPGVPIEREAPRWAKKGLFLMLMLEEGLARVRTRLDPETLHFDVQTVPGPNGARAETLLHVDLGTGAGRAAVEAFFQELLPDLKDAPSLVRSPDGHFMDKPDNVISCINLATVRSLEASWGCAVHPLRFRANFYIDGVRPWEEFDWIGRDIKLGDVVFRVDRRNGRCGATNVNPLTGERDLDIPGSLRKSFGHKDLGVYLVARSAGKVVLGDPITVPERATEPGEAGAPVPRPSGPGSFICRGCYFIYDESQGAPGAPRGTSFEAIADGWRCPDCGTEKTNFRRYVSESALAQGA